LTTLAIALIGVIVGFVG
jgi:hypothetical protein